MPQSTAGLVAVGNLDVHEDWPGSPPELLGLETCRTQLHRPVTLKDNISPSGPGAIEEEATFFYL